MKHLILKNTPFFRLIEMTDSPDYSNIQNDYVDFVSEVITLCHESADCGNLVYFALLFTEIELQYHPQLDRGTCERFRTSIYGKPWILSAG